MVPVHSCAPARCLQTNCKLRQYGSRVTRLSPQRISGACPVRACVLSLSALRPPPAVTKHAGDSLLLRLHPAPCDHLLFEHYLLAHHRPCPSAHLLQHCKRTSTVAHRRCFEPPPPRCCCGCIQPHVTTCSLNTTGPSPPMPPPTPVKGPSLPGASPLAPGVVPVCWPLPPPCPQSVPPTAGI